MQPGAPAAEPQTEPQGLRRTAGTPLSKPIIPDAAGFHTIHCPNCEEPIRFRTAATAAAQTPEPRKPTPREARKAAIHRDYEALRKVRSLLDISEDDMD